MEFTQEMLINGLLTGLGSTIIMTVFMLIGKATKIAPMDLPVMMGELIIGPNTSENKRRKLGMAQHLIIGTVWGLIYILTINNQWYFTAYNLRSGLLFALIPWSIMMLIMMPIMGVGFFGLRKSPKVPIMTLILHLIYGGSLAYIASLL